MAAVRVGDPFAIALLQWPAIAGLWGLPEGPWGWMLGGLLGLWVLLLAGGCFRGAYRTVPQFGGGMLICATLVALFWWAHPGPWQYPLLGLLWIFFAASTHVLVNAPALEGGG